MNNPELGKLITDSAERDAVHIAIYPATAGEKLRPGDHVGIVDGEAVVCEILIGIADPFLRPGSVVLKGQRFWLLLYPNTIQSLRHHWIHPRIREGIITEGTEKKPSGLVVTPEDSKKWIEAYAASRDVGYETLMGAARASLDGNIDYRMSDSIYDIPDDFWNHFENVSGIKVEQEDRADYFSCAC